MEDLLISLAVCWKGTLAQVSLHFFGVGAYSSTSDVSGTYMAGIFGSMPWILMYVACHEKELGTVRSST